MFICGWFTYAYFCGLSENKTVLCAEVRGPSNLLIQLRKWTVQRAGTTTFLLIQEVWKKRCQYRRGERRAWFIGGGILEWVRIMEAWKKYFGDHKNTTFVLNTILARISETRNSCIYIYIYQTKKRVALLNMACHLHCSMIKLLERSPAGSVEVEASAAFWSRWNFQWQSSIY